jgi:hypothetical protein
LEKAGKHPIELEEMLSRVALKRMQINKLIAMVDEGVGPMSAVTVVLMSIRLAFSLFINFSVALDMLSGKIPSFSTLVVFFPRTLLASVTLICLANAVRFKKRGKLVHPLSFFKLKVLYIAGEKGQTSIGQNYYLQQHFSAVYKPSSILYCT